MGQYEIDSRDSRVYPMGLTRTAKGIHAAVTAAAKECSLILFAPDGTETVIPFPQELRHGQVWEMTINGTGFSDCTYGFEADGKRFSDPCGVRFLGLEKWGDLKHAGRLLTSPVARQSFDWEGDQPLHIPYEDCIVYRAHVRGLTMDSSSGVRNKGTFRGVIEKIPYLKELGITTLELLPVAEFDEVIVPELKDGAPYRKAEPTGKLNYWGYTSAHYYAPKASYAGKNRCPVTEFKRLVKALHQAGIEVVTEFFFTGKESPNHILDIVRFWVREYHVDVVHVVGDVPSWILAKDPYLTDTKLWCTYWDDADRPMGDRKNLGEYNDGYLVDMRRALKGDEDQMSSLVFRSRRNPAGYGVINYLAGTNGFTLADMVSYEQKHNEANGEDNRDGTDYNYTWNCGEEGKSIKKKLLAMRRQQLKNALLMLFLSQGTPLILAGDEFGNSQQGNNNAYCQDNQISWVNWKKDKGSREQLEFVKHLIAFRKKHPVFHMPEEPRVMDYRSCGKPDVSYHGVNAWKPEYESFRRQIGILYWGEYGTKPDGTADDTFFVAYNMHWEPHEFALPNLSKTKKWALCFDTSDAGAGGFFPEGSEKELPDQKRVLVQPRTILVFTGKDDPAAIEEERKASVKKGRQKGGEKRQKEGAKTLKNLDKVR